MERRRKFIIPRLVTSTGKHRQSVSQSCYFERQCCGSGFIWLSLIRIRIRNGNADPDPGASKLTKNNKKPCSCLSKSLLYGTFVCTVWYVFVTYSLLYNKHLYFSCKNSTFCYGIFNCLTRIWIQIRMDPHWFAPLIRICIRSEIKRWIRIRIVTNCNQCGSTTLLKGMAFLSPLVSRQ